MLAAMVRQLILSLVIAGVSFSSAQSYYPWSVISKMDRLTDENLSYMSTSAFQYPYGTRFGLLTVRCTSDITSSGGVEVFFKSNWELEEDPQTGLIDVMYRVDRRQAISDPWWNSNTGDAVFLQSWKVQSFLKELATAEELAIRVPGLSGDLTFVLRVANLGSALDGLSCYTGDPLEPVDSGPLAD